jgi:hypothetical protein
LRKLSSSAVARTGGLVVVMDTFEVVVINKVTVMTMEETTAEAITTSSKARTEAGFEVADVVDLGAQLVGTAVRRMRTFSRTISTSRRLCRHQHLLLVTLQP